MNNPVHPSIMTNYYHYYYSALCTPVVALAATLLPHVASAQTLSAFPDSKFDVRFQELVDEEVVKIDLTENGRNIQKDFVSREFSRSSSYGSVSLLDSFQYAPAIAPPVKCKLPNAQFGKDGFYTEAVCAIYDVVKDVVCPQESSCSETDVLLTVTPGKGSMLQQQEDLDGKAPYLSWALCLSSNDFDTTKCELGNLPQSEIYDWAAIGIQYMISLAMPNTFDNPLLTYGNDQASPSLGEKFILGDGRFELIEEVYNTTPFLSPDGFEDPRSRWPTIDAKVSTIGGSLLHQYAKAHLFDADEDKIEFYKDVMLGYFLQRYANDFFGPPVKGSECNAIIDGSMYKYRTFCAVPFGALVAHHCAYDAEDIYDFMVWFFTESTRFSFDSNGTHGDSTPRPFCGRLSSRPVIRAAKKTMIKTVDATPIFHSSKPGFEKCARKALLMF